MSDERVIAYADKTILKISGLSVKGLNTSEVERTLAERLKSVVRVIGVTGSNIDMDIYGLSPEQLQADEAGIIKVLSTVEGITATEVASIAALEKAVTVDFDSLPSELPQGCAKERWLFK